MMVGERGISFMCGGVVFNQEKRFCLPTHAVSPSLTVSSVGFSIFF